MYKFIIGIAIGTVSVFLVTAFVLYEHEVKIEKRCVEVNAGTYEAGKFKYTDDKVKYILTGKK